MSDNGKLFNMFCSYGCADEIMNGWELPKLTTIAHGGSNIICSIYTSL